MSGCRAPIAETRIIEVKIGRVRGRFQWPCALIGKPPRQLFQQPHLTLDIEIDTGQAAFDIPYAAPLQVRNIRDRRVKMNWNGKVAVLETDIAALPRHGRYPEDLAENLIKA